MKTFHLVNGETISTISEAEAENRSWIRVETLAGNIVKINANYIVYIDMGDQ